MFAHVMVSVVIALNDQRSLMSVSYIPEGLKTHCQNYRSVAVL